MATELTPAQWEIARILVARMRAEAAWEEFDIGQLGFQWLVPDDLLCGLTEDGKLITIGDVMYGALALLWSVIIGWADARDLEPGEVIAQLGIGLAAHEP